jgi:pimeloyl-ACP methyl ester carboxylesterase
MKLSNPLRHPFRVPRVEAPLAEGRIYLRDGRGLGYAEFGDPAGAVVLWFHGTLGARRQFPMLGRQAAERLGLRVVVVERPGSGLSDRHRYAAVVDWAADMAELADALGAERLGVVGLSGGGPFALSCGAVPRWSLGWPPWPC